ncbi:YaaC family protein [Aeribacillus alveayuensis]|uniref:YaaC n=1 Tax=Aeribacillus alveayuensis TaxID=279215 RepID=A0ABT9VSF8_9BACI|nr:hypothetical protein [Bacillus alveayuensis]
MNSIWRYYTSFHSSQTTQRLLEKIYKKNGIISPNQKAFQNCYTFMYYIMHAENYYNTAIFSPLAVKPTLCFYGISQLLKGALLTVDPDYPSNSAVLAHGVSTRKRKKQHYQFLSDEVKIQKYGLFGYVANCLFHMKHVEGEKFSMKSLLKRIPELQAHFKHHFQLTTMFPVHLSNSYIHIDKSLADYYHISTERLKEIINTKLSVTFKQEYDHKLVFQPLTPFERIWQSKLFFHVFENKYYLPIHKEDLKIFPEILVHYLILYNLSMISRYETEWWYDLLKSHSSDDYIFIKNFLDISLVKIPIITYFYFHFLFFNNNE